MALSAAMQWALANGMTEADVYKNINDFLATNPDAATTQAQMAQYGISPEDVAAATGGKSGGLLSGNILAGASWNSLNETLGNQLTEATGQQTSNYAVGGATTTDTLNQLNTFLAGGGAFDPNATVFLQTGGVDFIQGVDKETVKDNINQIVKTLGDQGVNVVLTGSPYAASIQDVQNNNFNPDVDPLFKEIANENKNVALVNTQGEILKNKSLLVDALHTNAEGTAIYNQSVIDALSQFKNEVPTTTASEASKTGTITNTASSTTVKDYQGNSFDSKAILSLAKQLAPTMDATKLAGGVYDTKGESIGFNYDEATKLLGHDPTAAEQVVLDMARQLNQAGITDLSQIPASDTSTRFGSTYTGGGGTIYEIQKDPTTGAITTSTWGKNTSDKGNIVAALSIGAGLLGIPTQLGATILGTGNTIAAGALGGGLFGAGTAALTGTNILKGALMGAAGGAAGEYFKNPVTGEISTVPTEGSIPFTGADYSLANGVGPQGLDTMGGAQGLQPGTSANLPSMGGGQGITLNLGPASTSLSNALSTFGGMNPANLDAMGGGQGLTYQTPTGLVTQGGLIPTGDMTGNNNVIGETGVNTAFNIGDGIGDTLAKVDTGIYNPLGGMLSSNVTGFNTDGVPVTKNTPTDTSSILDKLTTGQIANIVAGIGGLAGGSAIAGGGGVSNKVGISALPTQGIPLNSQDYFNAIQQNYNRLLPAVPRDVASPLRDWYTSQYGA